MIANGGCSDNWYNYNVVYAYDIAISGSNAPSSLWTLQGYLGADDGTHYLPLPNNGGVGQQTSASNVTRYNNDCASATPASLGCNSLQIEISGPGIAYQKVNCSVTALPVELIGFEAKREGTQVAINWQTASELNNDYFTIERSVDGINFETVELISGAGTTTEVQSYTAYDIPATEGTLYYRLKQTDYDGTFTYSDVVTVAESKVKNELKVYPNPNQGSTFNIDAGTDFRNKSIEITGIDGRKILSIQPDSRVVVVDALPRGMYFIRLTDNSKNSSSVVKLTQK